VAEDSVQEDTGQESDRPNSYTFATFLFGGWAALMIAFTLIAVVAMSVVGMVAG
jgi:hypothetical protein